MPNIQGVKELSSHLICKLFTLVNDNFQGQAKMNRLRIAVATLMRLHPVESIFIKPGPPTW